MGFHKVSKGDGITDIRKRRGSFGRCDPLGVVTAELESAGDRARVWARAQAGHVASLRVFAAVH